MSLAARMFPEDLGHDLAKYTCGKSSDLSYHAAIIPFPFALARSRYDDWSEKRLLEEVDSRGFSHQYEDYANECCEEDGPDEHDGLLHFLRLSHETPGMYQMWSVQELRAALVGRGVVSHEFDIAASEVAREEYIDLLATADLTDTFPHFLELPAEVRIIIYSGVCVPMPELPRQYPRQPAICRASKQLRNKSLSVFFGLSTFLLTIKNINWFEIPHESGWEVTEESSTSKVDAKWLRQNKQHISLMRHLTINFTLRNPEGYRNRDESTAVYCMTLVSFKSNMQEFKLEKGNVYKDVDGIQQFRKLWGFPKGLRETLERVVKSSEGLTAVSLDEILKCFGHKCRCKGYKISRSIVEADERKGRPAEPVSLEEFFCQS